MGLFTKIAGEAAKEVLRGGKNKNDVKVAKLELKKAKLEQKSKSNDIDNILNYSKLNSDHIVKKTSDLKKQCLLLKGQIENNTNDINKDVMVHKQFCYLYLANDFLINLTKYASGIAISKEQKLLIIKYAPFYDDVLVLDITEDNVDDDSLMGELKDIGREFKDMGRELKEAFVGPSQPFELENYAVEKYQYQINNLIIPDIDNTLKMFSKITGSVNNNIETNENVNSYDNNYSSCSETIECSSCHKSLKSDSKFCPYCGNKVERIKPAFCDGCGAPMNSDEIFCRNCGKKISY